MVLLGGVWRERFFARCDDVYPYRFEFAQWHGVSKYNWTRSDRCNRCPAHRIGADSEPGAKPALIQVTS